MTEPKDPTTNPEARAPTPPAAEDVGTVADPKVGYGRPPKKHRFQKGKSGNPRGRPRKTKPPQDAIDLSAITTKVFTETVRVPIDGTIVEMTVYECLLRAVVQKAIRGPRGVRDAIALLKLAPPIIGDTDVHGRQNDDGAYVRDRIERMAQLIEEQRKVEAE